MDLTSQSGELRDEDADSPCESGDLVFEARPLQKPDTPVEHSHPDRVAIKGGNKIVNSLTVTFNR